RRISADAGDGLAVSIDRIGDSGEVGLEHVPEELAADRPTPPGRADHGDRPWSEERTERRSHGAVVSLVDSSEIALRRRDRKRDFDLAAAELAGDLEPGVLEHAEHRAVFRQHLRNEPFDPDAGGAGREPLEQAGADRA